MSSPLDQTGQGGGNSNPPIDLVSSNPAVRAVEKAVGELQTVRGFIERDLLEARNDMRDVRDRLKGLEVKVDALPSKVWIGSVVLGGMAFLGAILTLVTFLTRK